MDGQKKGRYHVRRNHNRRRHIRMRLCKRTFQVQAFHLRAGTRRGCVLRNIQGKQRHCPRRLRCRERLSDGETECRRKSEDGAAVERAGLSVSKKRLLGRVSGRGTSAGFAGVVSERNPKRSRRFKDHWQNRACETGAQHFRARGESALCALRGHCVSLWDDICVCGKCGG